MRIEIALLSIWLGAASTVQAQGFLPADDPFAIDDANPEAKLPTPEQSAQRPLQFGYLLMDLEERAALARGRGDYAKALAYHRAAAKLVPERASSHRALCVDYAALNDRTEALSACRRALGSSGTTVADATQLVQLVMSRPGGMDASELEDARATVAHLAQQESTLTAALELRCELSLKAGDTADLRVCSRELSARTPESPRAIAFAWHVAMQEGDLARARELVGRAKRVAAPADAVASMDRATSAAAVESAPADGLSLTGLPMRLFLAVAVALLLVVALARRFTRTT
jgi:tetratricopeptide (TPR) repeat protein